MLKSPNPNLAAPSASDSFFFLKIRERKDRLLSKPLRGEAAAAAGLWKEGDEEWRVRAARVAKLAHEGFARRPVAQKYWSGGPGLSHTPKSIPSVSETWPKWFTNCSRRSVRDVFIASNRPLTTLQVEKTSSYFGKLLKSRSGLLCAKLN